MLISELSRRAFRGVKKPENIHIKKLESEKFNFFSWEITQTDESIIKIVGNEFNSWQLIN